MIPAGLFDDLPKRYSWAVPEVLEYIANAIDGIPSGFSKADVWAFVGRDVWQYAGGPSNLTVVLNALVGVGLLHRIPRDGTPRSAIRYRKVTAAELRQRQAEATYAVNIRAGYALSILAA